MAKKKVKSTIAYDASTSPGAMPSPCLYLDFQGKDTKQLQGVAVGDDVTLVVKGKVKGVSQRQRQDYDDPKKVVDTGTIDLDKYTVEVMDEEKNPYEEMAADEESE